MRAVPETERPRDPLTLPGPWNAVAEGYDEELFGQLPELTERAIVALAAASYNAGPRNVTRYGGVPPFPETLTYIERIIALLEQGTDS